MRRAITTALMLGLVAAAPMAEVAASEPPPAATRPDAATARGHWVGELGSPEGQSGFVAILLDSAEDGSWTAEVTCLPVGLMHEPCSVVAVDGRSIRLELATVVGQWRFDGEVAEDGRSAAGRVLFADSDPDDPATHGRFDLTRSPRPLDQAEPMSFVGTVQSPGGGLEMAIVLAETAGGGLVGHLDVPVQSLRAFPLIDVKLDGDAFTATLPAPVPATIEGRIDPSRLTLIGTFKQGPFALDLDFKRDNGYAWRDLPRPQTPEPPFPYREREIVIDVAEGFVLAGTLTLPDPATHGPGPYPAAVLISGSGQQDRDETIFGHKPFLVIADFLTRRGVAVMRYDDRGVGASRVDDLSLVTNGTSIDFARDTLAIVEHLRTVDEIDPKAIGLIGHSEGGIIAPMVATMTDGLAYLVLMAGPGVAGRDLLTLQLALGIKANGGLPDEADRLQREMAKAIDLLLADADEAEVRAALESAARATVAASALPTDPENVDPVTQSYAQLLGSPWAKYFLAYDPAPALREVRCPVLAINGTLDLQVWHEQNLTEIQRIMTEAGGDVTIRRYEGLNHLFQRAGTGSAAEYVRIETTFDEAVMKDMAEWILAQTKGTTNE